MGKASGGKDKLSLRQSPPSSGTTSARSSHVPLSSSRSTRPVGPFPIVFAGLFIITFSSFWHSLRELPHSTISQSDNAIRASLDNFKYDSKAAHSNLKEVDDPTWIDRIKEDAIPNPALSNGNETFSACLLVMVGGTLLLIFGIS